MPDKGDPGLTLAGVLILAALGVFAWQKAPLESARPTNEQADSHDFREEQRMPARLWQDPFRAFQNYARIRRSGETAVGVPVVMPAGKALQETIRNALGIGPDNTYTPECEARELIVIAATEPPGSYADIEERRRRDRYAILSALGDAGFVPRDAANLGFFYPGEARIPEGMLSGVYGPGRQYNEPAAEEFPVIYEWFDFEDLETGKPWVKDDPEMKQRSVLLLWVDNSWLGQEPFGRIDRLITELLESLPSEQRKKTSWVMLGPPDSDTLLKMVESRSEDSLQNIKKLELSRFFIVSPYATVSDDALRRDPADGAAESANLLGRYFEGPCREGETCMRFLRTINSDDELIGELIGELKQRGITGLDTVVVLSEWDTYFGRFFPRALTEKFREKRLCEEGAQNCPTIIRYTYERGIDGLASGVQVMSPQGTDKKGKETMNLDRGGAQIRKPTGASQFDYLRRLADMIREDDARFRYENGKGIRVVAILGTDIYDKLLIMRALREEIPGAIWITNDLDAHLLHPNEYPWTHNLIVASSFNLALPDVQGNTALPFRDSYQTSAYLATRLAIDGCAFPQVLGDTDRDACTGTAGRRMPDDLPDQDDLYRAIPPLLFEVGRNGAVKLGAAREGTARPVNESPPARYMGKPLSAGIIAIALLSLLALYILRPRSARLFIAFTFSFLALAVFFNLVIFRQLGLGEPLSLTDGVSIWPTEMIRLVAFSLALGLSWSCFNRLEYNWQCLNHRYFSGPEASRDSGRTFRDIARSLGDFRLRVPVWFMVFSALFLTLFLIMLSGRGSPGNGLFGPLLGFNAWIVDYLVSNRGEQALYAVLLERAILYFELILLWLFVIFRGLPQRHRAKSINSWYAQTSSVGARELWEQYHEYGARRHAMLRTAATTLVYFSFASIIFILFGGAAAPCRGEVACGANRIITGASVLAMLFLLFLVVDAIRLCICWIRKVQDPKVKWEGEWFTDLSRKLHIPEPHLAYWLQVYLIGQRTHEVGRLLYYPVLVILLMLLARSTYFDNWVMPQALALIVGINFLIALVSATQLNKTAKSAREEILDRLRVEKMEFSQAENTDKPVVSAGELKELMEQLSRLKLGAYQNILDQPFVRASFLLLGGLGVTYSEYLPLLQ